MIVRLQAYFRGYQARKRVNRIKNGLPFVETWNNKQHPAAIEHDVNGEHKVKVRDDQGMGHAEIAGDHVYLHHSGKQVLIRGHAEGVPNDHIHEEAKKQKNAHYAVHA